ncbi:protein WWC3-like isoform X2 [Camelus dromedarius]
MAEADRDWLQLIKEKEALLQELQLIIQQRRPREDVARLEEERWHLEEEIQRAWATSMQGATERILLQKKRNCLHIQLEEATRLISYLQSQLKSLSASTLTVSSGSSRGSLASSRGSLASSRGSLSSVSFTDIYGLPQYEKPDAAEGGQPLRFDLVPFDSLGRDAPFTEPPGPSGFHKQRRSLDTPQSLASLSSRSSLSSLSPPSSPLDTPFLPASRDAPSAPLGDGGFEVPGLGALDRLRAQASAPGDEDLPATAALQPHGFPGDGEGPRERGPPAAAAPTGAIVTFREDSAKRLERRARRVSACVSDYLLACDNRVFEPPTKKSEDADEPAHGDAGGKEGPRIHVGLLLDSASECLLVKVLQLQNFAGRVLREDCRVHIRVYLPPLDSSTPNTYCSKALESQGPLVFNEVFRIPVHSSMLMLKSLQLYVCSVNQPLQEELLGIAEINLADYDGSDEMQLHWYSVQVFPGPALPRREDKRPGDGASRDPVPTASGKKDAVTVLLARTTAQLQAVERELAEERVKLEYTEEEILEMERKEEQTEAVSEWSWQANSVDSGCSSCAQTSPPHPEPCCVGIDSIHRQTFAGQADPYSPEKLRPPTIKPCRSLVVELVARTSRDLELDLQALRTRQWQLNKELGALCELCQRLEDAQLQGHTDLPAWVLRDERFRSLLQEAERQTRQTKRDFHQEQAAEKMLKKASKGVCQLRGQNLKEPIQVQTFRLLLSTPNLHWDQASPALLRHFSPEATSSLPSLLSNVCPQCSPWAPAPAGPWEVRPQDAMVAAVAAAAAACPRCSAPGESLRRTWPTPSRGAPLAGRPATPTRPLVELFGVRPACGCSSFTPGAPSQGWHGCALPRASQAVAEGPRASTASFCRVRQCPLDRGECSRRGQPLSFENAVSGRTARAKEDRGSDVGVVPASALPPTVRAVTASEAA